jgi:hypothetical protein
MTTINDIAAEIAAAEAALHAADVALDRASDAIDVAREEASYHWCPDGALLVREAEIAFRMAQDEAMGAVAFLDRLRARAATAAA